MVPPCFLKMQAHRTLCGSWVDTMDGGGWTKEAHACFLKSQAHRTLCRPCGHEMAIAGRSSFPVPSRTCAQPHSYARRLLNTICAVHVSWHAHAHVPTCTHTHHWATPRPAPSHLVALGVLMLLFTLSLLLRRLFSPSGPTVGLGLLLDTMAVSSNCQGWQKKRACVCARVLVYGLFECAGPGGKANWAHAWGCSECRMPAWEGQNGRPMRSGRSGSTDELAACFCVQGGLCV